MKTSAILAVATSLFSTLTLASPTPVNAVADTTPNDLAKRAFTGDFTWYNPSVGIGACGRRNSDSELVVALNAPQFDPQTPGGNPNNNRLCGRRVRLNFQGRSADATIVDRCPGCRNGDLDLSPALFQRFASLGTGRIRGTWDFI